MGASENTYADFKVFTREWVEHNLGAWPTLADISRELRVSTETAAEWMARFNKENEKRAEEEIADDVITQEASDAANGTEL